MQYPAKNPEPQGQAFPVWTYEQAQRAVPYISSILNSIRERYLETAAHQRRAKQLADQPGRPDRYQLITQQNATKDAGMHEEQLLEALQELTSLNIHCVDPVEGFAMIPFVKGDQLAWFVFELHAEDRLTAWRFHNDNLEERRPLDEIRDEPMPSSIVV